MPSPPQPRPLAPPGGLPPWQSPLPPGPAPGAASTAQVSATPAEPAASTTTQTLGATSFPKIEKLRDGNWLAWKTRIATVLKWKEAYGIVTGTVLEPGDPVVAADWRTKDLIAQELITTAIKDEQVIHIAGCETSAQMWSALRAIHEPYGQQSILSTKRMLYRAQAKENTDIPTHLYHMRSMRERLARSGDIIDDLQFKYILVDSLPHSWEAFTTSNLGYQVRVMTVQELISLLCGEYRRRKMEEELGEFAYSARNGSHIYFGP